MFTIDIEKLAVYRIGMEKGLEQGLKKGIEKGLVIGREQGEREAVKEVAVSIARRLLEQGMGTAQVAAITKLALADVEVLVGGQGQ